MATVVQGGDAELGKTSQGATVRTSQSATQRKGKAKNTRTTIGGGKPGQSMEGTMQEGENPQGATDGGATLLKRTSKPAYLKSLNESEKAENFKIIDNMNKKISYLKNPRHKVSKAPILMTSTLHKDVGDAATIQKKTSFRVEPTSVSFSDYKVNGVYEIDVKVTNRALVSKRIKFVPPATENFTVHKVKYADANTGDLAPGMSLTFSVCFQAPSFADYDDCITFVTEEDKFKLPLTARRDPPIIKLVNPMDCMNSWRGDKVDMAFRIMNEGGDGGFKFFCERDEDDALQQEQFVIKLRSFTLAPSEFYLNKGQAIDIIVAFQPEKEGQLEENLILACDNQTSQFRKLRGYGAELNLDIIEVDGKAVDLKTNPMETMFFGNTNPTSETRRTMKIKNSSPIPVPFHWSVYKTKATNKIILEDEETHFRVSPSQGKIGGGEIMDFDFYFCPQHAEPYFEFGDLIVEDIPIQAVPNAPEGLKNFTQNNSQKTAKVPMPAYVGSSTQFLSIPIIQFNLRGQGNSCQVDVEPPISFFEGDTFIGQDYHQTVQLRKVSEGNIKYTMRMEGKNRESFDVDLVAQGQHMSRVEGGVLVGEISSQSITLDLTIRSQEIGPAIAYFFIEIEDGAPISFSCQADFRGPIMKLEEPVIDVGLAKVNTVKHFSITLENDSPIPANFILKSAKNKKLGFHNAITEKDAKNNPDAQGSLVLGRPVRSKLGNRITFDCAYKQLNPHGKTTINVQCECLNQETIEEYFEIMVQDSEPLFFQLLAEVQKPQVFLNRQEIQLGKIYAGVKETVDHESGKNKHQSLVLKNFGNLPAKFVWEEVNDPKRFIVNFEPNKGTIAPKSEVTISMEIIFYKGGNINELIFCDVQDLELPLGFEIKADAFGLNVAYLTAEEQLAQSTMSNFNDDRDSDTWKNIYGSMNKLDSFNFTNVKINKISSNKFILKNLSGINTTFNLNSIVYEPPAHIAPQQKSEIQLALEEEERRKKEEKQAAMANENQMGGKKKEKGKKVDFAESAKQSMGGTNKEENRRTQPILSDAHEQTQKFTSAGGNTFTQTKMIEKDQAFFLKKQKGIAIVFSPNEGDLPANGEVPVTVTIYNNVCGKFDDTIVANIDGLNKIEFPVRIQITGSPVVVPNNQVGLNYNTLFPTLPMPTIVAKTNEAPPKQFTIKNTGARNLSIDWNLFDQKDLNQQGVDPFKIGIAANTSFDKGKYPFKFDFQALEPEESKNSCFTVEPKNTTIGPRTEKKFTVTFDPKVGVGRFNSIILATPYLSQEEIEASGITAENLPKKGTLGNIALNFQAHTIAPRLQLDKSVKMDGDKHFNIKYWSTSGKDFPEAPKQISKLIFSNDSKADMKFEFGINGPFEIVRTKTNTGAAHPLAPTTVASKVVKQKPITHFVLQPLKIVELHVKFNTPKPSDTTEWPMIMSSERHGEVTASFDNGDTQKFLVHGKLLRPKVVLLTEKPSKNAKAMDELDFGICNVDKGRTIKIYLSNITEVTAKWKLNYITFPKTKIVSQYTTTEWERENLQKVDDANVFEFSMAEGELQGVNPLHNDIGIKGKTLPLRNMPEGLCVPPVPKDAEERKYLPQPILINFKPQQNVLYKSKFRFTVANGLSCDIILKGKGSFEENHD